jgi:hypothetical protein
LRLANVHLILGDGMEGYARAHPMRHRRCGRGSQLPLEWCEQLAVARLVAPTALADGQQVLLVVDKTAHGFTQTVFEAVHFVPLKSGLPEGDSFCLGARGLGHGGLPSCWAWRCRLWNPHDQGSGGGSRHSRQSGAPGEVPCQALPGAENAGKPGYYTSSPATL